MGMRLNGLARRLTVFVDESDRAPHSRKPLYCQIVHLAHETGLAGASAFRGVEGYGASRHVHVNRILSLSGDLPVAVVIVDTPERIDAFVPLVAGLVTDGLITVEDLRAIAHAPGSRTPRTSLAPDPTCIRACPGGWDTAPRRPPPPADGQMSQVPSVQPRPTAPNPPSRLAPTLATA
jgi:PII-like signaling protein